MNELALLRAEVCEANRALATLGLAVLTWGNVSRITSDRKLVAIKPSGVGYEQLTPESIVVVDLKGRVVEGTLRASVDTPTHLAIYVAWRHVGAVVHAHSPYATMFAQARQEIPCLGTTHADHFAGDVPVTRQLTAAEVGEGYEAYTGQVIVERFRDADAAVVPGVLVAGHGPFVWGRTVGKAMENAVALEAVARMAHGTMALGAPIALETHVLDRHYQRKHGENATYGQ
jgi:L-ribulose-5-phosphate 4-epimerase